MSKDGGDDGYEGDDMNRSQMNRGGSRGAQQTGAVANMDADLGDEEGVTVSEYNRWLIQEDNWNSAEETRSAYMEGSQFRKTRDEKHREKGMERQAASIEQMKLAKGRVEEHREHNLEQGKTVRDDVSVWKQQVHEQKEQRAADAKAIKEKTKMAEKAKEEKKKLLDSKKELSAQVRGEVAQLTKDSEQLRMDLKKMNEETAKRVKAETADVVTDSAKKMFFEQRRAAAQQTSAKVKEWEVDRKANREKLVEQFKATRQKAREFKEGSRGSRKALQTERARSAAEVRKMKSDSAQTYRDKLEERAAQTKLVVNATISERFVQSDRARHMLQHPHYSEVTAVVTDVTSQVSKEIAASPRRKPPSSAAAALGAAGGKSAALRMNSGTPARKGA